MRKTFDYNPYLDRAVADYGGQGAVARDLNVSQGLVGQWIHGKTRITAERALQLVRLFRGAVTVEQLCPCADWAAIRVTGGALGQESRGSV